MRPITCPHCRKVFDKTLASLKADAAVVCPDCGKTFQVRRYKAQAVAAASFKALTGFSSDPKGS